MNTLKQFFKHKETFIGMVTAFAFLLIFFCIWMTAYDGVTDRIDQLTIGFVNEDEQMGVMIEKEMIEHVPFEVKKYTSIDVAKEDMNERAVDMVMQIPASFSSQLLEKGETKIHYFINQANASMGKQMMDAAAINMTQSINKNVYAYQQQLIATKLPKQMDAIVPSKELAQNLSENIAQVLQTLNVESVQASIEKTNNVDGFAATMVPMMIVLASFVGSMMMSLNLNIVSAKLKNNYNKWSVFFARQVINVAASVLLAAIALIFLAIFHIEWSTTFWEAGIFQILVYFSFISLTQMFVIVFGTGGMVFNILCLSLQLVTSGVIVPKAMLSSFYQTIGSYLPATYAADGYYTVIFGGVGLTKPMVALLLVSAATVSIAIIRIALQKHRVSPTPKHVVAE